MPRTVSPKSLRTLTIVFALMLLTAGLSLGQQQAGNVVGRVTDSQGDPLPGVTVTLSGIGAPQVFVTSTDGAYRFLGMAPGTYAISTQLEGFAPLQRNIQVNVGANTEINFTLGVTLQQAITVSAATPLIDIRDTGTSSTITEVELENVPSARDPWVVLQTVPGVLVDRVNVGGNKSGQQSYFIGKGVERHQTGWNLDGVNVTEMQATGTSNFYYDFDSFEEFSISTGGSDASVRTPGVQINMVTKRGTNEFIGSGRYFWTDESFQDDPKVPEEAVSYLDQVNSINNIQDYGVEAGGPLLRDRLWLWGAYSENPIDVLVPGELFTQETILENWNAKLNAQLGAQNNASIYYMRSDKVVFGRGIGPSRPLEASQNQSGPGYVLKLEDTHQFSPRFYATLSLADIDNGYKLEPRNGDVEAYWTESDIFPGDTFGTGWRRNYRYYEQNVPQESARIEASNFVKTGRVDHELKWGFGYRDTPVESWTIWPGNMTFGNFYDGSALAALTRPGHPVYGADYTDLHVTDTLLLGRLTVQGGLRYDLQRAKNGPSSTPANPVVPDLLPEASYPGDERSLEWETISPRIGATYDVGLQKRTVVRASYNRYVDQLGSSDVGSNNPFWTDQILYYYWEDLNGDRTVQRDEIDFDSGLYAASGIDPDNPLLSPGRVDYDMDPTTTDEFILGAEREFLPGFVMGINYTYRFRENFVWNQFEKTKGGNDFYTQADYELNPTPATGTLPDGTPYSVPFYRLRSGRSNPIYFVTTNRPDYHQSYNGIELTAAKRMTSWMIRGNVTLADWEQSVGPEGFINPTPIISGDSCTSCDGAAVASSSGADGYINSRWSASLNGVYQARYGIILGAAVIGREGYIIPYYHQQRIAGSNQQILIGEFDDNRLDDVFQLDFRVSKDFSLPGDVVMNLSADLFNATNERTVLWRTNRVNTSSANRIAEIHSPRVWRFGARLKF